MEKKKPASQDAGWSRWSECWETTTSFIFFSLPLATGQVCSQEDIVGPSHVGELSAELRRLEAAKRAAIPKLVDRALNSFERLCETCCFGETQKRDRLKAGVSGRREDEGCLDQILKCISDLEAYREKHGDLLDMLGRVVR